jgi:O-antigen ligase
MTGLLLRRGIRSDNVRWAAVCFVLMCYLFVPSSIAQSMTFSFLDVKIFAPEVLLLVAFSGGKIHNKRLALWAMVGIAYGLLNTLLLDAPSVTSAISSVMELYLPLFICAFLPSRRFSEWLTPTFVAVGLVGLSLEVLLYSTGILQYHTPIGQKISGEFVRISTTAGAATATGVFLFLLTVLFCELWLKKGWILGIGAALGVAATVATLSRGSILMVCATGVLVVFGLLAGRSRSIRSGAVIALIAVSAWAIKASGADEALVARGGDNFLESEAREERADEALDVIGKNLFFGVGYGQYWERPRYTSGHITVGATSPHNMYLLQMAEGGIVGLLVFVGGAAWLVLRGLGKFRTSFVPAALISVVAIGMNTEVLYCLAETGLALCCLVAAGDAAQEHRREGGV